MEIINNYITKCTLEEIDSFEMHNELKLPVDYKDFLIKYNGGKIIPSFCPVVNSDVSWIYGMANEPQWASLYYAIDTFSNRIPSWYFPIARDSAGNQYIMSLFENNFGIVAFWKHEFELKSGVASQYFDNIIKVADSFTEFIMLLDEIQ